MDLLVQFKSKEKSPLEFIKQLVDAIDVELRRKAIKEYQISLVADWTDMQIELLHAQEEKEEPQK